MTLDLRITFECPHCGHLIERSFWEFEVIFTGTSFLCDGCESVVVIKLTTSTSDQAEELL